MAEAMAIGPEAVQSVQDTFKQLGATNGFAVTDEYLNSIKDEAKRIVDKRKKTKSYLMTLD